MYSKEKCLQIGLTLITGAAGGLLFSLIHLPIPWLLGPMIGSLIGSSLIKNRYVWPAGLRNTGLMIVGYTIGMSLTVQALRRMGTELPYMLILTAMLLLFCAGIAWLVSRISKIDYRTALLGSIPGGLTQVIALAEETRGINLTVVTLTQVVRLMMIVILTPLIVFSPFFGAVHGDQGPLQSAAVSWSGLYPELILFAAASMAAAWLGNRIHFPTAFFLGPALITAALQLCGLHGPVLPKLIIDAAQLLVGIHIGLMLKMDQLIQHRRSFLVAVGSALLLIAGALGLSALLTVLQPVSMATALLSLAPGGMDQMGIIAHEIGANLSIVAGYQVFRTFFIFLAVPPLLRLLFRLVDRRRAGGSE
ncbi:AbrB family transcriptional regulator [Paenibacillus sp. JX-17]|uniref:AbrB family transcriptional regulator n=1 Tax=Paenibacillus lacisoli TaxID=3064525 RepID=A0ABT9CJJ7_9BACL|nr:AbrB family transcriptional regulator [Paenibacillus sp. JX-17]MDO7907783.1 AbrB family transcriptional regulator [Paenibacillus sp. JX-17]